MMPLIVDGIPTLETMKRVQSMIVPQSQPNLPAESNIDIKDYLTDGEDGKASRQLKSQEESSSTRIVITHFVHPVALAWKDLDVRVVAVKNTYCSRCAPKKCILRRVTGIVKSGSILAIMGSSGAGKSTLMNVLTARNIKGLEVHGTIYANGIPIGREIRNISAYVQQDDMFLSTLTVREQLQFRAMIQMDKSTTKKQRMQRVEDVIFEMGLVNCANSEIGVGFGSKRGISGGERKRLSFASETLNNPPLIFCDEPTSGLDTFMAQNIVNRLQHMASKGHTVLCTIHQPSSELFAMFHQILLMSCGRVAYFGSTNDAMDFFTRLNFPCPNNFNPADHYILTIAIRPDKEEECRERSGAICDAFEASPMCKEIKSDVENIVKNENKDHQMLLETIISYQRASSSWCRQFRCLLWRSWISLYRNIFLFRIRVSQSAVFAIVLGLIYFNLTIDQKGVMNVNGAIFVLIINVTFSNAFAVINSFPEELGLFLREYGSGIYRTDVYFLAFTITEAPMFFLMSVIFVTVVYFMIGFYRSVEAFLWTQLVLFLTSMIGTSFGYFVSTVCGSVAAALAVGPSFLIPFMLFGGLFLNISSVPFYFKWANYLSWFQFANEIVMVTQWTNIGEIECAAVNIMTPNKTMASGSLMAPENQCMFRTGEDVLEYTSFEKDDVTFDLIMLVALMVGFRILAFVALLLRAYQSKE